MKILASDVNRYVPQQRLVERVKFGTGFISSKTAATNSGGAFYLTEYKGDGILSVLDAIVPIVGTVANVVSKGANFYKELRGNGIEPEALAEVLKVEDTKPAEKAVGEETAAASKANASETKTGKGFFYISPR
jgi:hypothetical protein